jgi:hypothetical protein
MLNRFQQAITVFAFYMEFECLFHGLTFKPIGLRTKPAGLHSRVPDKIIAGAHLTMHRTCALD